MCALYLLFLPPYSPVDPAATADAAVGYDYYTDDPAPTTELPGKQSPSPLPDIAYLSLFILCIRHLLLLRYSYSLHSLTLSPLAVPSLSYAACYYYVFQQLALRHS